MLWAQKGLTMLFDMPLTVEAGCTYCTLKDVKQGRV
jgi:hypothetical protein